MEYVTFGNGCFWCTEAVFARVRGVKSILPGYAGGNVENPEYEMVCTGETGHAEVTQIEFDPKEISFEDLLEIFWHTHDPTTLNRQGNDIGTQYRSAIFYHSDEQKQIAEKSKITMQNSEIFKNPIVTEITSLRKFYPAEEYHKKYYDQNQNASYCRFVIEPKIQKLVKNFGKVLDLTNS